jgi:hypothetical protein
MTPPMPLEQVGASFVPGPETTAVKQPGKTSLDYPTVLTQ